MIYLPVCAYQYIRVPKGFLDFLEARGNTTPIAYLRREALFPVICMPIHVLPRTSLRTILLTLVVLTPAHRPALLYLRVCCISVMFCVCKSDVPTLLHACTYLISTQGTR